MGLALKKGSKTDGFKLVFTKNPLAKLELHKQFLDGKRA